MSTDGQTPIMSRKKTLQESANIQSKYLDTQSIDTVLGQKIAWRLQLVLQT